MDFSSVDMPINQPLSGIAMHAFLALSAENRPEKIPLAIARATAHALLTDLCYLISAPEDGKVICFDGFNRVKEEILSGIVLPIDQFPELSECYYQKKALYYNNPDDLSEITQKSIRILGQVKPAPFCVTPIIAHNQTLLGALLVISPYSGRTWTDNDITLLNAFGDSVSRILQRVLDTADLQEQVRQYEAQPQPPIDTSADWVVEATGEPVPPTEQTAIQELDLSNSRLAVFTHPPLNLAQIYQAENELLLEEITHLRDQLHELAAATNRAAEAQSDEGARAALERIREELHHLVSPLSAITGYHDLLISESVGNLTEMQQKFLDRIRFAAEKLHHTIDEIEQVAQTGIPEDAEGLTIPVLPLQNVVEESFKSFQQLIHDRHLEIKLLSPADIPRIKGKYQEIQPIVHRILNSLLSITPTGSSIQSKLALQVAMDGKRNVLWKATSNAQMTDVPSRELDEFSEYLQENVFSLAERLDCQLWMDTAVHTERQVNLLFAAE